MNWMSGGFVKNCRSLTRTSLLVPLSIVFIAGSVTSTTTPPTYDSAKDAVKAVRDLAPVLTPDLLAYVPSVKPLNISYLTIGEPVQQEGLMLHPDPKTYWDHPDRLIAPAGATYQTALTMGAFTGTQFGSNDFYIGSIGPEDRDKDEVIVDKAAPIPERLRPKRK